MHIYRYSTQKHASITREPRNADFDPNEKFWTRFPPEGSKLTPPHQVVDFKWKDYCPVVFKYVLWNLGSNLFYLLVEEIELSLLFS